MELVDCFKQSDMNRNVYLNYPKYCDNVDWDYMLQNVVHHENMPI